jgi:predicted nucleic acid-binding protein
MWTPRSIKTPHRVPDQQRRDRGLIDTSVLIGLERITPDALPREIAIASITLAELAAGPHATDDHAERARRQDRLQRAEATFDPLPFDTACARAYGHVYAHTRASGRKARGRRAIDLLIAATALASDLPLFTTNPLDFAGFDSLIDVIAVTETVAADARIR